MDRYHVPDPPALNIARHVSSGLFTTNGVSIKCGRSAQLRYTRTIASGMTLKVRRGGTEVFSENGPLAMSRPLILAIREEEMTRGRHPPK